MENRLETDGYTQWVETAFYRTQTAIELIGNPLVEALPAIENPAVSAQRLLVQPPYDEAELQLSRDERLFNLQRIGNIHIPTMNDTMIAMNISRCLRWGYFSRNPMPWSVVGQAIMEAGKEVDSRTARYLTGFKAPSYGFPVIGVSGVGKTCSVLNVLTTYPQVIQHQSYRDVPFQATQLVWLKVDCPGDGSPKGLCVSILKEIDNILGTDYAEQYSRRRSSKDSLLVAVSRLFRVYHMGIMMIDDIQSLCGVKDEISKELLSFLVHMINTIGVPVIMVGTPKILSILQAEFQQAKRATGEGEIRMDLMKRDSKEWDRYIRAIWHYQFTRKKVVLTDELNNAFFEESVGNPFLASILYKLVQDEAIILEDQPARQEEAFTAGDVRRVASSKLAITAAMRKNMLNGTDVELKQYEYLWNTVSINGAAAGSAAKQITASKSTGADDSANIQADLEAMLMRTLNLTIKEVRKYARDACSAFPEEKNINILLGYAITLVGKAQNTRQAPRKVSEKDGYEDLKMEGYVENAIPRA